MCLNDFFLIFNIITYCTTQEYSQTFDIQQYSHKSGFFGQLLLRYLVRFNTQFYK